MEYTTAKIAGRNIAVQIFNIETLPKISEILGADDYQDKLKMHEYIYFQLYDKYDEDKTGKSFRELNKYVSTLIAQIRAPEIFDLFQIAPPEVLEKNIQKMGGDASFFGIVQHLSNIPQYLDRKKEGIFNDEGWSNREIISMFTKGGYTEEEVKDRIKYERELIKLINEFEAVAPLPVFVYRGRAGVMAKVGTAFVENFMKIK